MDIFKVLIIFVFLNNNTFASETFNKTKIKPHEELLVVQTVSTDRRSFVVSKGVKDGVFRGQEVVYANENVSILCKALEVSRDYSLWAPIDQFINIPFKKEEIISYNTHSYGSVGLDIVGDINNIIPEVSIENEYTKFRISNNFALKASFDRGLFQSSSDVSADKNSTRAGYSLALEYNYRFMPEFEMSFGARIDNEVYSITEPRLDIPTTRKIATIGVTYHVMSLSNNKNNFYLTLAAGLGTSQTTVSEVTSTGYVTLLPEVRLGYIMPFSKTFAMVFEGSVESLNSHETFPDQTVQLTNILNTKFSVGLRF